MAETFVYASRIKDLAKKHGLRMSGDAAEALNAQIAEMVKGRRREGEGQQAQDHLPVRFLEPAKPVFGIKGRPPVGRPSLFGDQRSLPRHESRQHVKLPEIAAAPAQQRVQREFARHPYAALEVFQFPEHLLDIRIGRRLESVLPHQQDTLGPDRELEMQPEAAEHVGDRLPGEGALERDEVFADRCARDIARRLSSPASAGRNRSLSRATCAVSVRSGWKTSVITSGTPMSRARAETRGEMKK